jgi:hypothetical protein
VSPLSLKATLSLTAQQLPVSHAVAKPSEFNTRWPGVVKARNAATTTNTANVAIIFFMSIPCGRAATAILAVRRGEPSKFSTRYGERENRRRSERVAFDQFLAGSPTRRVHVTSLGWHAIPMFEQL